jgi:CTP synthase
MEAIEMTKYIFVTGGVVSSIGKGIASASIGRMLKNRGFDVTMVKVDPYVNVDAGTMNPFQHGEVFVTDDRAETDLDLGNYERFCDVNLNKLSSITTGSVYASVIAKERRGDYLSACVQVVPHITDEIKDQIQRAARDSGAEIVIVEIGGTVGDIESLPFLEAIRQFKKNVGAQNVFYVHVTLIAEVGPWGEMKTKPTQHSVIKLREIGIQPDLIVCRAKNTLSEDMREKISLFCDVEPEAVVESANAETIYEVPLLFEERGMAPYILDHFRLEHRTPQLDEWRRFVERIKHPEHHVRVAIVGKYTHLRDAYTSVMESSTHAGAAVNAGVEIKWIESSDIDPDDPGALLSDVDGLIVPGGFGERGVEGKIAAVRYARENGLPYLGLCYGLQMATIEFARNVCGLESANTTEVDPNTPHPVIHLMSEQEAISAKGGTMRLGTWPCRIEEDTLAYRLYGEKLAYERHRHRYEVNNEYRSVLAKHGMTISGTSPDGRLVEMVELPSHPYFVASQFHPEFKSRPNRAHPLFVGLITAAIQHSQDRRSQPSTNGSNGHASPQHEGTVEIPISR